MNHLEKKSRQMSKILRHDPTPLTMDSTGWIMSMLLCNHLEISQLELEWVVEHNDKNRFMFNDDKTMIRAAQGHSIGIAEDMEYMRITALQQELLLYHGTDTITASLIKGSNILPGKRQYVHWSDNIDIAMIRAKQRAYYNKTEPALVILNARSYIHGGGKLLKAENDVYLTGTVNGNILMYCLTL